jgi:hypothetical protein
MGVHMQVKTFILCVVLLVLYFSTIYSSYAETIVGLSSRPQQSQLKSGVSQPVDQSVGIQQQAMNPSVFAWVTAILERYLITVLLILFGAFVVWAQYKYLALVKPDPDVSLPAFSLTLIITGTLVLVSVGPDTRVLGTVVGLFGTIAGYVLGRSSPRKQETKTNRGC